MAGANQTNRPNTPQDPSVGTSRFSLNMQYAGGANQPNIGLNFSTNSATSQIDPLITRTISQNRSQIQPTMRNAFAQEPLLAQRANLQQPTTPNLPHQSRYSYTPPQMYSQAPPNPMSSASTNRLPQNGIVSGLNPGMPQSPYTLSSTPMQTYQRAPEQINMLSMGPPRQYQSTFLRTHHMQQYRQMTNPLPPAVNAQQLPRVPTNPQDVAVHRGLFLRNLDSGAYNQATASRNVHMSPSGNPSSSPAVVQHPQSLPQNIATGPYSQPASSPNSLPPNSRPLHPLIPSYRISTGSPTPISWTPSPNNRKRAAPVAVDRLPKRIKTENGDNQTPLDRKFAASQSDAPAATYGSALSPAHQHASIAQGVVGAARGIAQQQRYPAEANRTVRNNPSQVGLVKDMARKRKAESSVNTQSTVKPAHSTVERECPYLPSLEEKSSTQQPSGAKTSELPVIQTPQQPDQSHPPSSPTYPYNTSPKPSHPLQVRAPILWKHNTANIDDTLASIWNNAYDIDTEKREEPEKAPDQGTRTLQEVETLLFEELRSAIASMDNANGSALPRPRMEQRKKGAKKDLSLEADASCPEGYVPAHEVMPSALGYVGPKKRN